MSNKLYNWAYILMNILQAKNTKHKFFEYRCLDLLQKRSQMNKQLENFLAITDVRMQTRGAQMGGVVGFFVKELKNS